MSEAYGSDFLVMEQLLAQNEIEISASEADGRLAGLLAMVGRHAIDVWLAQLLSADGKTTDALQLERAQPLQMLAVKRATVIDQGEGLPILCLPDDEDHLRDRVDGLVHWSAGFLSGLAEGAAFAGETARSMLDQEPLAEMLKDLSEITQAAVSDEDLDEDVEQVENSYVELVEFLRVACQLAYENLADVRGAPDQSDDRERLH